MNNRDKTRLAIASFGTQHFNYLHIRKITGLDKTTQLLCQLNKRGEIAIVKKRRDGNYGLVNIYRATASLNKPEGEIEQPATDLPGWRAAFPEYFIEPKFEGSVFVHRMPV